MLRAIMLSAAALAGATYAQGAAFAQTLSLEEAIEAAIETHPAVGEAEAAARDAQAGVLSALSSYRPRVTLRATAGYSDRRAAFDGRPVFDETASPSSVSLELSHRLYASGRRAIEARHSQVGYERARLDIARTEDDLARETALAWFDVLAGRERLIIETDARRSLVEALTAARAREARGVATQTDIALAETRLAEAEARIGSAQAGLEIAGAQFQALTGLAPASVAGDLAFSPPLPASLAEAIEEALFHSLDLEQSQLGERQATLAAASASRRNGATIDLSATAQRVDDPSPVLDRDDEARAVISLTLPLYSGGETRAALRSALARRDQARLATLRIRTDTTAQVRQVWASLQASQIALSAQERRVSAALEALRGVEQGREAGLTSQLDVLDALRELQLARLALLDTRHEQIRARVQLAALTRAL